MPEDEYTCEHCGATFDSENALRGHVNLQCDGAQQDDEEAMDDEEWIERAQKLRNELEDVVDSEVVDNDDVDTSEQAHVRHEEETKREAHADDVREAIPADVADRLPEGQELGSVKMIQGNDGPQMYIEIGGIMLPLQANFQVSEEDGHTVIEAIDPHDTDTVVRLGETPADTTEKQPRPDETVTKPESDEATDTTVQEASAEAQDLDAFSAKQELIEEIAETYDIQPDQIDDRPLEDLRRLKRRLEQRDGVKEELIHKYDVPEGQLVGKSLDELRERKEKVQEANELRDELEERFGIEPEGDRRLEELQEYEDELEQRRDDAIETLERFDIDADPDELSLEELEAKAEEAQTRDELIDEIIGYADYTRDELQDKDIDTLENLLDEKDEAAALREAIEDEFEPDEELDEKTLDELNSIQERLEEAAELREHLTQFYDVEMEELQEKDLEELKELEDELEEIEDELHDVLGEHGIKTDEDEEEDEDDEQESTAGEEGVSDEQLDDMEFEEGEAPEPGEGTQELEKGKKLLDDLGLEDIKEHGSLDDEEDEDEEDEEDDEGESVIDRVTGLFSGATGGDASLEDATLSNIAQVDEIEEHHDATVLLAHTLKQFLELQLGIGRELTYMEIVDALQEHGEEEIGLDEDDIERLVRFFKRMHLQTYKGGRRVDLDASREMAEEFVRQLS